MSYDSRSIAKMISKDFELSGASSGNSKYHSLFSSVGVKTNSFFNRSKSTLDFPDSYPRIWNKISGGSNLRRIKALLLDYTKEKCFLGSFFGRVITGHWNRHHVSAVSQIIANMSIKNYYESTDDVVADLKLLKPEKGGSLDQRIKFIEMKLEEQLNYEFRM
ncbi:DUF5617 domain-containing protein [Fluoribacter dumoffii]|uniref:RavJ-like C-terminal domain-containing protein n=1 Tax=Fluoribacter dumoffii TaxID=463 RepID=A0A377GDI9_9GAMM|nr:DUF5617 domain-containing protein [Fluoribacter dumoffii]KTC90706.1 substrate of the Dot/Icm secretion system [Fluoribacter dumoffii NY 23]MCW8386386.1 DUF5617 domain-containing protein [Fluoribacter dumoffii]MCW8419439.1 DUF5617 domain-containing protein [Fluoribacter dumoffii]MCW8452686.1 DUF5617 domain-containing protein [Fluoribacter dumoffii]MCW8460064.1 DUF5617 domain-containing protein [Fluoribacter dumoffii]